MAVGRWTAAFTVTGVMLSAFLQWEKRDCLESYAFQKCILAPVIQPT
jgi:hypothetical protein